MPASDLLPRAMVAEDSGGSARRDRFRALYDANYRPLLGYAMRRTESEEDAADVVAESFTTAWRRLDDIPPGDEARLWLYGVARRALSNQRRGDRRRERLGERLVATQSGTSAGANEETDQGAVRAAFGSLRAQDREILALAAWEELDATEIGAVLGCSPNASRIRLHRARRRFAAALEDRLRGGNDEAD